MNIALWVRVTCLIDFRSVMTTISLAQPTCAIDTVTIETLITFTFKTALGVGAGSITITCVCSFTFVYVWRLWGNIIDYILGVSRY